MKLKFQISLQIIAIGFISIFFVYPAFSYAQTTTPSTTISGTNSSPRVNQSNKLSMLHTLCDTQINNRLNSLNNIESKINNFKKLSNAQKAQYSTEITSDINALTALKSKCDSDTDITTLRSDYRSIFTAYRIYAVFDRQINRLALSDKISDVINAFNSTNIIAKLQSRIVQAGNPSNLTALLADLQAKLQAAQSQVALAQSQVISLTPSDYNSNPNSVNVAFDSSRVNFQTAQADLKAAMSDLLQIRQGLKTSTTLTTISPTP